VDAAIQKLQELKLELDAKQKVHARAHGLRLAHTSSQLTNNVLQEFEKATGKASAQNKEAFRGALVRGKQQQAQQSSRSPSCGVSSWHKAPAATAPLAAMCIQCWDPHVHQGHHTSLGSVFHTHAHACADISSACMVELAWLAASSLMSALATLNRPMRWSGACSTSPPSRSMAAWQASMTMALLAAPSSRT
jgi:hypothetical protein